jgi:hypothetical protein
MQAQTIRPKHPSVTYLIIMLFSISAFIFTGCARHSGLSSGEVKNIQSNGQVIPLETRGPVQVSSSGEGSSVPTLTANAVFLKKTSIISTRVSVDFQKCSEQNSV